MEQEYLVLVTDGSGGFGYAHGADLDKTAKKARAARGLTIKEVWTAYAYQYPKDYQYTINHFPLQVLFHCEDVRREDIYANVKKIPVQMGKRMFNQGIVEKE